MAEEQRQRISNRYEVLEQIGLGGMGVVYRVRHIFLDRDFALKVLPSQLMESQELIDRFRFEAQLMAQLDHPNIVKVSDFDYDAEKDFYYYVMEYIQGKTLSRYLRDKGPLPLPEVLDISRQAADALTYAHNRPQPITRVLPNVSSQTRSDPEY